jgi:glyoxalase/bleomycin resistance protein/dioxygenase superfamily protein
VAIIGMHALIYSKQVEELRRVFKDALGWPSVDAGHGWLIFAAPPTELAVHPAEDEEHHELYLMCDDIKGTLADLSAAGVEIVQGPTEAGWGVVATIAMPSGAELSIYEPRHPVALVRG